MFATSALFLWLNGALAHRLAKRSGICPRLPLPGDANDHRLTAALQRLSPGLPWRFLIIGSALALAALIALGEVGSWDIALRFIWQAPYGQSDPLYGKDIGFYLFSLPAYVAIKNWMLLTLVLECPFRRRSLFCAG